MGKIFDSPRSRRLRSDERAMTALIKESSIVRFTASGSPPDLYTLSFRGPSTYRSEKDRTVKKSGLHRVEIRLGAEYPRMKPMIQWLTPIFHPNISNAGSVCLGGYTTNWVPSVGIANLCEMLWDMLRYANFDIRSPFNREAAAWVKSQTTFRFPLDERPLRDLLSQSRPAREEERPETPEKEEPPGAEGIFFIE
ncbi:MAG: ubiquitin-conjugating enzyme E2 [Planctomycetota bacterium]|jgi:ubiquitin-protein ligase